jgi:hypothetical protein
MNSCPGRGAAWSEAERCTADPGPSKALNFGRSRVCSASPSRVEDARKRAYGAALRPGKEDKLP